jgi:hypothetical protein
VNHDQLEHHRANLWARVYAATIANSGMDEARASADSAIKIFNSRFLETQRSADGREVYVPKSEALRDQLSGKAIAAALHRQAERP